MQSTQTAAELDGFPSSSLHGMSSAQTYLCTPGPRVKLYEPSRARAQGGGAVGHSESILGFIHPGLAGLLVPTPPGPLSVKKPGMSV